MKGVIIVCFLIAVWCGLTWANEVVVESDASVLAEVDTSASAEVQVETQVKQKLHVRRSSKPSKFGYNKDGFKRRCDQDQVDLHYDIKPPHKVPHTKHEITLPRPVKPFHYWMANNGYCSEAVLLQAGLAAGQYMSQFNVRKLCGSGHGQSGGPTFCDDNKNISNYNAQMGLEIPGTGTSGPHTFAHVGRCAAHQRLDLNVYDGANSPSGWEGYRHFMSWIKGEFIKGRPVGLGLMMGGNEDEQYDHVVNVQAIGTNHYPFTADYYDDDVLVFDDNGALSAGDHGTDEDCHPYYFRFSFKDMAHHHASWFRDQVWGIVIPNHETACQTKAGGNGLENVKIQGPNNMAWSSSGPMDDDGDLVPVHIQIMSTALDGKPNKALPLAGFNFEPNLPEAGLDDCVEARPDKWLDVTLAATASSLVVGETYNMYQYILDVKDSTGFSPIAVPTSKFNAQATVKPLVFKATESTYTTTIATTSDKVVVVRCVLASAP